MKQNNPDAEKIKKALDECRLFYVPFCYAYEELPAEIDETIHYTDEALSRAEEKLNISIASHHEDEKQMHFRFIKNESTNEEFLPLFTSPNLLREYFPAQISRICIVGRETIETFRHECCGVLVNTRHLVYNDMLD